MLHFRALFLTTLSIVFFLKLSSVTAALSCEPIQAEQEWCGAINAVFEVSGVDSGTDLDSALAKARETGKSGVMWVFVMSVTNSRADPFSRRLIMKDFSDRAVQSFFNKNFVSVLEPLPAKYSGLAKELKVRATPTIFFFDIAGKLVNRFVGSPRDAEELLWLGEYVVEKAYTKVKFPKFKRMKRDATSR